MLVVEIGVRSACQSAEQAEEMTKLLIFPHKFVVVKLAVALV